jgi:broad specificity phosphatase PhoE
LNEIWLARHGETAWSRSGKHTGRTDVPLEPEGEAQARALGVRLTGHAFEQVWTSPRVRARRTAELAGFHAQPVDDLAEWNYGEFEGLKRAEIQAIETNWDVFAQGAPAGESVEDIAARADRVIARLRAVSGDVLVFGHGHFLRVLGARWIGLPVAAASRLLLSTASVSVLGYEHGPRDPAIVLWNDVHHLPKESS